MRPASPHAQMPTNSNQRRRAPPQFSPKTFPLALLLDLRSLSLSMILETKFIMIKTSYSPPVRKSSQIQQMMFSDFGTHSQNSGSGRSYLMKKRDQTPMRFQGLSRRLLRVWVGGKGCHRVSFKHDYLGSLRRMIGSHMVTRLYVLI